jgi:dihydrofolate reductase
MNAIIMGRKTYESIGFALSQRVNYVLSRSLKKEDVDQKIHIFDNLQDLLKDIEKKQFNECWIIGGAEIYKLFLESDKDLVNQIYITKIKKDYNCDTFFSKSLVDTKFKLCKMWPGINPELEFAVYTHI